MCVQTCMPMHMHTFWVLLITKSKVRVNERKEKSRDPRMGSCLLASPSRQQTVACQELERFLNACVEGRHPASGGSSQVNGGCCGVWIPFFCGSDCFWGLGYLLQPLPNHQPEHSVPGGQKQLRWRAESNTHRLSTPLPNPGHRGGSWPVPLLLVFISTTGGEGLKRLTPSQIILLQVECLAKKDERVK